MTLASQSIITPIQDQERSGTSPFDDEEEFYPGSDGKPMAETDKHADLMVYCKASLRARYAAQPDVYVSGNNFIYYHEGDRNARISPDCYVVFGVENRQRDSYKVWSEGGRLPAVVFEFTSRKTRREDVHTKRPLYERALRIPEYFQFDPTGDYLKPRLHGFRLVNGRYVPLELNNSRLFSDTLKLELVWEGETLRLYDPQQEEWLLTPLEEVQARRTAEEESEAQRDRADAERRHAEDAETEIQRLRVELEVLKRQRRE